MVTPGAMLRGASVPLHFAVVWSHTYLSILHLASHCSLPLKAMGGAATIRLASRLGYIKINGMVLFII